MVETFYNYYFQKLGKQTKYLWSCSSTAMVLKTWPPGRHLAVTEDKIELKISVTFQDQLNCYDSTPAIRLHYFMSLISELVFSLHSISIVTFNSLLFIHVSIINLLKQMSLSMYLIHCVCLTQSIQLMFAEYTFVECLLLCKDRALIS